MSYEISEGGECHGHECVELSVGESGIVLGFYSVDAEDVQLMDEL